MEASKVYANRYHDTSMRFQGFFKLMMVWKGSVMKLIWHDLLMFLILYSALSMTYRYILLDHEPAAQYFELMCIYSSKFIEMIPITFLTGFYVTQVVARYWDQFMSLPWPDRIAFKLVSYIPGKTKYVRTLRRTVMRYVNLSTVLVFRLVAAKVHSRFPDYRSLIQAKILLPHEATRLQAVDARTPHETTYIPILWAMNLITQARKEGKIKVEAPVYSNLISAFDYLETCNRRIFNHGWVNFPLAYTQVATLSVFSYFFAALFGRQYLVPRGEINDLVAFPSISGNFTINEPYSNHTPDMFVPFFTILEFISYFGWIKVAETLLNPFGDDDEDFQINYLIDRNFQVSYLIVDEATTDLEMKDDPWNDDFPPSELPYKEDFEPPSFSQKRKMQYYRCIGKVSVLRKVTGLVQYKRAHRCQSTRSRLRSLNENRNANNVHHRLAKTRRVHQVSEMSIIEDEILKMKSSMKKPERSISTDTSHKRIQFDFSTRSFNDDNEDAIVI